MNAKRSCGSLEADGNDLRRPFERLPGEEPFRQERRGLAVAQSAARRRYAVKLPDAIAVREIGAVSRSLSDQAIVDLGNGSPAVVDDGNEQGSVDVGAGIGFGLDTHLDLRRRQHLGPVVAEATATDHDD